MRGKTILKTTIEKMLLHKETRLEVITCVGGGWYEAAAIEGEFSEVHMEEDALAT
jgi:hypothetical protein